MQARLFIFIVCCFTVSCISNNGNINENPNDTKGKSIEVEGQLVGKELGTVNEKEIELNLSFDFQVVESYSYDINNDGNKDEIILEKIKDWDDPGDYHRIKIRILNDEYCIFNNSGWVKYNNYILQHVDDFFSTNFINSDYLIIRRINDDNLLLFAFGYTYASQSGLLSIIRITKNEKPRLIFNDNYFIYSFNGKNENKVLKVTPSYKNEIDNNKGTINNYRFSNGWFISFPD